MNKRFYSRMLFTMFPVMLGMTFAPAQSVHMLAVQDALDLAKKNNIQVKTAFANLSVQEQTNKQLTADALPLISGTGTSTNYFQIPVIVLAANSFGPGVPAASQAVSLNQKYNLTGGVQLTQKLFDGAVFVGLKARSSALDYYRKNIDLTIEGLSVNVYKTYYSLVVSTTQLELLDANITRAAKFLHDTKVMNENGFAEKLDVNKAVVQLANLQTSRENTETNIVNGYLTLKFLIGIPAADSVQLTTRFDEAQLKGGIPMDLQYRYEDRYDFQSLQISKQLSEYDIKRYQAVYYPTLSLNGAYQKNALNNTFDLFSKSSTWYSTSYVGLSLNVPIFSGFSKDANLKKARLQSTLLGDQLENLKQSIDVEVRTARNNFLNAINNMDNQRENTGLAESVYDQTKKKYESGLASSTDLTNAQTDLIQAQSNYINALYNAVVAKVDYLKAIGKI
ncbi:MAG TPA: TolC family protein [Puia sp.]